jgi:dolichyl-phosphate-mannose-protein mannosyltransferase
MTAAPLSPCASASLPYTPAMRLNDLKRGFLEGRLVPIVFLLILSYFSIVHNFWNPAALFWDENYHIASAQKYLNGIYFMEPHPPLGKLLIALGEKMFHPNALNDQFINTDYGQNIPAGFSFFGYRFFPVILAWLTTPILFLIFRRLTKRNLWAVLLTFFYIFDNAILVHVRSAMLESTLLFFSALMILAFLMLIDSKDDKKMFGRAAMLLGASFGLVMATKLFGLILVLFAPALLWFLWPRWRQFGRFLALAAPAFLVCYLGVWYVHFAIGSTVNPKLPDSGFYQATPRYQEILKQGMNRSLFAFPIALKNHIDFVPHYQAGVPRLDLAKTDENGSPWFLWPVGARTINYRWETDGSGLYRYLYLVPNPAVWAVSLLAVIFSVAVLIARWFLPMEEHRPHTRRLLVTFLLMYLAYMAAVSRIDRVMYLYHYFLPLMLTFLLIPLVLEEITRFGRWTLTEERKGAIVLILAFFVFAGYQIYRPFTYYEPISDGAVQRRNLLNVWELRCVNCERNSPFVVPRDPV